MQIGCTPKIPVGFGAGLLIHHYLPLLRTSTFLSLAPVGRSVVVVAAAAAVDSVIVVMVVVVAAAAAAVVVVVVAVAALRSGVVAIACTTALGLAAAVKTVATVAMTVEKETKKHMRSMRTGEDQGELQSVNVSCGLNSH